MRTTIIPAQITTVEDKIAGSLNMTQILILMAPILWTAIIYILLAPSMKLTSLKLVLIIISTATSGILALRIKDKIVAEWLGVLLKYRLRPKYYLFNKNDLTGRTLDIPELPVEQITVKKSLKKISKAQNMNLDILDQVRFEHLIASGKVALNYQLSKK
jgi:hypothetical protein